MKGEEREKKTYLFIKERTQGSGSGRKYGLTTASQQSVLVRSVTSTLNKYMRTDILHPYLG